MYLDFKKLIKNSWGKDKGKGGFICDKKIMFIYMNFSFDFLGLDNVDFENYFAKKLIRWVVF
jgi:C1A family cysteine protease